MSRCSIVSATQGVPCFDAGFRCSEGWGRHESTFSSMLGPGYPEPVSHIISPPQLHHPIVTSAITSQTKWLHRKKRPVNGLQSVCEESLSITSKRTVTLLVTDPPPTPPCSVTIKKKKIFPSNEVQQFHRLRSCHSLTRPFCSPMRA